MPETDAVATMMGVLPAVSEACSEACGLGGAWGCVGQFSWGGVTEPGITARILVSDAITRQPVAGAAVSLCMAADPVCDTPHAEATTGEDGTAALVYDATAWPAGFPGYFRVVEPGDAPTYAPTLVFRSRPLVASEEIWVRLLSQATATTLASMTGETPPEGTPLLMALTLDCQGFPSAGVSFSLTPGDGLQPLYLTPSGPLPGATATTWDGTGLFPAVPTGDGDTALLTLAATLEESGTLVSQLPVVVRRGHLTAAELHPTALR